MTRGAMCVEHAASDARDGTVVITTGARYTFADDGSIAARQRLSVDRPTVRFALDNGTRAAPWRIETSDGAQAVLRRDAMTATVRGDSVIMLRTDRPTSLAAEAAFDSAYHESHHGRTLVLDEAGGFGVYPLVGVLPRDGATDSTVHAMRLGGETWLAVFPPRAADPAIESSPLAHEGRPHTLRDGLDAAYPSRTVLEDAARTCQT